MNKNPLTNRNLELTIESYYPSLTKSEKKVADFIIHKGDGILYYSITDFSEEAYVSESTILRFCRRIGMKGYQDFKLTLAKGLAETSDISNEQNDKETDYVDLISGNTIKAIQNMSVLVNREDLEDAVDLIYKAKSVYFFGVGTSGLTALDAKNRFIRVGKTVDGVMDPHIQAMIAATLTEDDVVVGISVSGSTQDTIDSLKIAGKNGAKIIALTYYLRSPITKLADIVLPAGEKESPLEGGSLAAKIAQLYMVDLLCTGMVMKNKDYYLRMNEKTADAVVNKIL